MEWPLFQCLFLTDHLLARLLVFQSIAQREPLLTKELAARQERRGPGRPSSPEAMNTGQAGGRQRRAEDWTQATSSAGTRPTAGRKLGQLLNLIHFDLIQLKKKKRRENWRTPDSEALACLPSMWGCMSRAPRGAGAVLPDTDVQQSEALSQRGSRCSRAQMAGACPSGWRSRWPWMDEEVQEQSQVTCKWPWVPPPPHVTIRGQLQIFPNVP